MDEASSCGTQKTWQEGPWSPGMSWHWCSSSASEPVSPKIVSYGHRLTLERFFKKGDEQTQLKSAPNQVCLLPAPLPVIVPFPAAPIWTCSPQCSTFCHLKVVKPTIWLDGFWRKTISYQYKSCSSTACCAEQESWDLATRSFIFSCREKCKTQHVYRFFRILFSWIQVVN